MKDRWIVSPAPALTDSSSIPFVGSLLEFLKIEKV